jgi:hypothetical protein
MWGHAAVEDFLYKPRNDHLLFPYLRLSHSIGHEKVSSSIRRVVSIKRKLKTRCSLKLFLERKSSCAT